MCVVADHKDLNDEGQTVNVSKTAKSVPPKTGDNTMLWLYGGLFVAAFRSMLALVIREYARIRRQAKEDCHLLVDKSTSMELQDCQGHAIQSYSDTADFS